MFRRRQLTAVLKIEVIHGILDGADLRTGRSRASGGSGSRRARFSRGGRRRSGRDGGCGGTSWETLGVNYRTLVIVYWVWWRNGIVTWVDVGTSIT